MAWLQLPVYEFEELNERAKQGDIAVAALHKIAQQQQETMRTLQANGIVFDGPLGTDPSNWQHVAFSIYTDLCEVDLLARTALQEAGRVFG